MAKQKMVDCPKCYGEGKYMCPVTYFSKEWEQRTCDLCHGTGQITQAYYDKLMGKDDCNVQAGDHDGAGPQPKDGI